MRITCEVKGLEEIQRGMLKVSSKNKSSKFKGKPRSRDVGAKDDPAGEWREEENDPKDNDKGDEREEEGASQVC